jgi:membrane protein implicated in regulation of membrane protease activity
MDEWIAFFKLLTTNNGWMWLIVGVLLFIAELLVPGVFFVWFALAALVTGGLQFIWPMSSLPLQLLVFSGASVVSLLVGRAVYGSYKDPVSDKPFLNKRAQQLVGRTFVLKEAINNGRGRVEVGESMWLVTGPDAEAGTRIRVTGVDGTMLVVESVEA